MDRRAVLLGGVALTVATVASLRYGAPTLLLAGALGTAGVAVLRPAWLSPASAAGCSTAATTMTEPVAVLGGCWPAWLFLTLLGSIGVPVLAALNGGTAMLVAPYSERLRALVPGRS